MDGSTSGFYSEANCDLADLRALVEQPVDPGSVPNALEVRSNIPVYDAATLAKHFSEPDLRRELLAEWAHILHSSAGVFAIRNAQPDLDAIDQATAAYEGIIAREKETLEAADHFAAAGSNDRIWNSLQKLAETAPEVYVRYFASPAIDAASEAWLGPNYQMTAQINLVHPGGKAQRMHRDYHLGFQTAELSATYPAHVHDLSPLMTLQGGLAHCDVPIASGSTKLLPFSQMYRPGYAAWRRDDYQAYFEENFAQLPLQKGDAVFFNPALFHAAGDNTTKDVHRMVNLFQVSSAFGRSLENVNRRRMCEAVYDALALAWNDKTMSEAELDAVLGSTAEGYPFPTNLDTDPPVGGLAPKSQKELMKDAILAGSDKSEFVAILDDLAARQSA